MLRKYKTAADHNHYTTFNRPFTTTYYPNLKKKRPTKFAILFEPPQKFSFGQPLPSLMMHKIKYSHDNENNLFHRKAIKTKTKTKII